MWGRIFGGQDQGYEGHDGRGNQSIGSNVGRGTANPTNVFLRAYKCYSPAFIGKNEINRGNKIILPTSALHELARLRIQYPMTFMISNQHLNTKSYCGVLEFSAEEGMCHIPIWMMNNLYIEEGQEIVIRSMNLRKGTYVKIQPHKTAFIDLKADPKVILENELTHYSVLHKGDTINIQYGGQEYAIDIVECKPDDQICCVEADINLDFEAPKDYVEPPKMQKQTSTAKRQKEAAEEAELINKIKSKYVRIDGKQMNDRQVRQELEKVKEQMKQENPNFDPRKHRLQHGIRNFVASGEQSHDPNSFKGVGTKLGM